MRSRKMYAIEFTNNLFKVRVPLTGSGYDPDKHFLIYEESDYLSEVLQGIPYATYTTDDPESMEGLLTNGQRMENGEVWMPFFAYWKDQEGHAFLVPENSGITDLSSVGIQTKMKSPADFMKVGKYVNRTFASLPKNMASPNNSFGIWGKEVSYNEEDTMSIVLLDIEGIGISDEDKELSIKYVDLGSLSSEEKAIVDGAIIVSEKAVRSLGLAKEPRLGMAWRGTFLTERGLGKGHILYKSGMDVDICIYGPKKVVQGNRFFFGSMGALHVGNPHTDRQAFINFHMHREGLGVELAKSFMREVIMASRDEHSMRQLLLKYTSQDSHESMSEEAWILRRALAYGVSFLRFPALFRRVVRYLMTKVMDCEKLARIPMNGVAKYGYVLPDPNAIDSEGNVVLDKAIPEGCIVFPDLPAGTRVVCYRQPSENSNAWVALKVIERPEYRRFAGRGICLLGQGADKVLGRLGGGDMDDQFVIVYDPIWVEAFHNMTPYPETEKLSSEPDELQMEAEDIDFFTEELMEQVEAKYSNRHVSWQIELAKNTRVGIGPVVNFGMIDMLLSDPDHRESILADLEARGLEQVDWVQAYMPYQAAKEMTNLEIVIDGAVKDPTLSRKLGDVAGKLKAFHMTCKVYPTSMANRVPLLKQEKGDYVLAMSLTCKALAKIKAMQDRMMVLFTEREWDLVMPADKELRGDYPFEAAISKRVRGTYLRSDDFRVIREPNKWEDMPDGWSKLITDTPCLMDLWVGGMAGKSNQADALEAKGNKAGAELVRATSYTEVCKEIANELQGQDDDYMERVAVEIYYQTYRRYQSGPKTGEDGKVRGYSDGLLWSPVFANHFINALRKSRLCGYYASVELFPAWRRRLNEKSVVIQIRGRVVYIQDYQDNFTESVGYIPGSGLAPDGKYRMDSGLIEFRKPQAICLPEGDLLQARPELTKIYEVAKSIPMKEVKKKEVKPRGKFGELIAKAFSILNIK